MEREEPLRNKGNRVIRVGIAGFGMSGKIFQAPFLHANEHFEITKVMERTTERSKEEYPYVTIVRSFEDLLTDDIDLVVISTPNSLHVTMAKQAILAGKNVIVEKPIAASSDEAEELCRLAQEKKLLFSVYQNRRLDGDFLTVKKLIEQGRLGEVVDYEVHYDRFVTGSSSKKWKAEGGRGIGILYDLGVHIIDQAYCLFGMPETVYADMRKQRSETNGIDSFRIILSYAKTRVTISAGELVVRQGPHYMVNGRKGTFIKYGMDVQEEKLIAGERPIDYIQSGKSGWGYDDPEHYGSLYTMMDGIEHIEKIPTEVGNYGVYYDNIYQCLTGDAELMIKPHETVQVLKIIEAAMRSDEEGRRISLS